MNQLIKKDWFPFVAPFVLFMGFLFVEGLIDPRKEGTIYWIYAVKTLCVGALIAWVWRRLPEFRIKSVAGSCAVGAVVFALWVALDPFLPWLEGMALTFGDAENWGAREGGFRAFEFVADPALAWAAVAVRVAGAVLVVPIMEEAFWRGWLQRWLVSEDFTKVQIGTFTGMSFAVVTAAFALVHPQVFVALIAGVLFGWWVVRTKSLWDVVLAHAVANLLLAGYVISTERWYLW